MRAAARAVQLVQLLGDLEPESSSSNLSPEILDHTTDLDHEGEGRLVGICRFLVSFPSQVTLDASRGDVAPSVLFNNTI